jgi:hypothetical protein
MDGSIAVLFLYFNDYCWEVVKDDPDVNVILSAAFEDKVD